MATTSGKYAASALDALESCGVRFALLHDEAKVAAGQSTSDIDLVAEVPAADVVTRASEAWVSVGLFPILLWPYDVGGTASIFLATGDASDGVQLDVLYDTRGLGKYGVRSNVALNGRVEGMRWPRISATDEDVYLAVKRAIKSRRPPDDRALEALRSPRGHQVLSGRIRKDPFVVARRYVGLHPAVMRLRRITDRLRTPIGFWAHIAPSIPGTIESCWSIAARFGRFLPHSTVVAAETRIDLPKSAANVLWLTRKPSLVLTAGEWPLIIRPGLVISASEVDDHDGVARSIVKAMHANLVRRLEHA